MGVARWLQSREVKHDINVIRSLSKEGREALYQEVFNAIARIQVELRILVSDILFSDSFHIIENSDWASAAWTINTQYRLPLIERAKNGDDAAMFMQLGASVILHSIRAILDYELHSRRDLMLFCQTMWYDLTDGDFEKIPLRFHGSSLSRRE